MLLSGSSRKLALLRHKTTRRGASVPRQYRLRRTRRRANTPGGAPLSADAKVRRHPSLRLPATQPPKTLREAAAHGAACSCQKVGAARRRRPPTAATTKPSAQPSQYGGARGHGPLPGSSHHGWGIKSMGSSPALRPLDLRSKAAPCTKLHSQ
jgi:hypothetical protein